LRKSKLTLDQIDLVDVNEAFAPQFLVNFVFVFSFSSLNSI
jgi:acetyl-CoA acetyltransferase